ncbi:MAG: 3' terminal RNA ribose 2'-O-methyltransferase Hen1 [Acidimicrobiales bacterium]|nr:3' terminal RNA ribose 2'-O-methyltransferase Hen1 [Acidimicrobiales bacterium]
MILTISTTYRPATDLGYLLRKNPDRHQTFDVFGATAHVFYPVATDERCTVALLLEVDPIDLVRRRGQRHAGIVNQYVNDRPYGANSLLSVALGKVFSSARTGKSLDRPELAASIMPLEVTIAALPSDGGAELICQLFEPLGYIVEVTSELLDSAFPQWGESRYHRVDLSITAQLSDVLTHLTVLIPSLDGSKHYWVGDDEVDKLLHRGGDWLSTHPLKDLIMRRYLMDQRALTREALRRLSGEDYSDPDERTRQGDSAEASLERPMSLNEQRMQAIVKTLHEVGAKTVADLGCGEGKLLELLIADSHFTKIIGMDVSLHALERSKKRLYYESMAQRQQERIQLIHGSLTYRDKRLSGWDAATVIEVIEHLDPDRLIAFCDSIFGHAQPSCVIITTPNADYNEVFTSLNKGELRHPDHRFEWSRHEFAEWAQQISSHYKYRVQFRPVGDEHLELGSPTQMAVFSR